MKQLTAVKLNSYVKESRWEIWLLFVEKFLFFSHTMNYDEQSFPFGFGAFPVKMKIPN